MEKKSWKQFTQHLKWHLILMNVVSQGWSFVLLRSSLSLSVSSCFFSQFTSCDQFSIHVVSRLNLKIAIWTAATE